MLIALPGLLSFPCVCLLLKLEGGWREALLTWDKEKGPKHMDLFSSLSLGGVPGRGLAPL